jgi:hypothetical protein
MSDNRLEEAKKTILQGIEALVPVAEHQRDKHARNSLLAQAASLNTLGERIELHQLPEGFVRSVINDVRLDTLMILTELKVSLTFQKQELAAPNEKLRAEVHERRIAIDEVEEVALDDRAIPREQRLWKVLANMQVLENVEKSLRNCML